MTAIMYAFTSACFYTVGHMEWRYYKDLPTCESSRPAVEEYLIHWKGCEKVLTVCKKAKESDK